MILLRYLTTELFKSMMGVTVVLLVVILSARFIKYLKQVAEGDLAAEVVVLIMLYRLPNFMEMILPLAMFIGILLSYGRLYVQSEIVVMNAGGVSRWRLLMITLFPAAIVSLLVAWNSLSLSPAGISAYQELLIERAAGSAIQLTVEGQFREDSDGGVVYIEKIGGSKAAQKGELYGLFLARPIKDTASPESDGGQIEMLSTRRGILKQDPETRQQSMTLIDGNQFTGAPGEAAFQLLEFESYTQWLEPNEIEPPRDALDSARMSDLLGSQGLDVAATLQWRISLPVLVPVLAILALALSETNPRRGQYSRLFPAIVLYLLYLVGLNAAREAVASGEMPVMPGLWAVHGLFLGFALALFFRNALFGAMFGWMRR